MFTRITGLILASFILTTVSHSVFAKDYLHELADEAASTAKVSSNNQLEEAEQKELEKMEALLESERPSTYRFYSKLYPKNKKQVFKFFANDKSDQNDRLTHLQKKVMDTYFNQ